MDDSLDWSTRIAHEASLHDENCFVTLTFRPDRLPTDHSVHPRHLQLFMKRLRKALGHGRVRFFACGEYGEEGLRPHYHVILFGYRPSDLVPWKRYPSGHVGYRSAFLEKVWTDGHVEVGTVTTQSAGYVARYCTKKVTGEPAESHYTRREVNGFGIVEKEWKVRPEFITMSTKPGIGRAWYDKFSGDAFPSDFVVIDGERRPVPRYYVTQYRKSERDLHDALKKTIPLKSERQRRAAKHADNNTPERLATREESQHLRASRLKRDLENPET